MRRLLAVMFLGATTALACGGGAGEIGDACTSPGSREQCTDDAVCELLDDGDIQCLLVCVEPTDCPEDFDCNGTSGSSIKACFPQSVQP